ncbi:DNA endonuclease SmrA [Reinekea thalattae]|uniref:DNA endonuclease SmrA n=1 Tax=Reinekea thalattae TaxID=2593301 RepID=A0A5C8ZC40_9GAMM|nr:DNA endonuclease SmrA [Reinekea thalattae]TXR54859.1 DNA endonuclease SmrA [Reinekea thalattae]
MIEDDEFDDFMKEMKGVEPLKAKQKVDLSAPKVQQPSLIHRRQMAVKVEQGSQNHLTEEMIDLVHPLDVLEYRSEGVSLGVFRNLKRGQYAIDARLDLHQKRMKQAREEVFQFIKDCRKYDIRSAIILHGKGESSEPKAFLKSCTNTWLKQIPEVLAFHSAQKHHGGVGALYVLIKKSERTKQENRIAYNKGRIDF